MYYLPQKKSALDFSFLKNIAGKTALGMTISDDAVHFVVLKKNGDPKIPYRVLSYGTKDIPAGVVINTVIKKPEPLIKILKQIQKLTQVSEVALSVSESIGSSQTIYSEGKTDSVIRSVIRSKLEESLPSHVAKTVFYFNPLAMLAKQREMLVRIIPAESLRVYRALFKEAGLILQAVEFTSDSVSRMITSPKSEAVSLSVHIGESETTCAVVSAGRTQASVALPFGSAILIDALQKSEGLTKEGVHKVKKERGFVRAKGEKEVLYGVATILDKIVTEIKVLVVDWHDKIEHQDNARAIEQVLLSGSEVTHPGIQRYLAEQLVFPVTFANIWATTFDFTASIPPIVFEEALALAPAIGVAVGKLGL